MSSIINVDTLFSSSQTVVTKEETPKLEMCASVVAEASSTAIDTVSSKNCEIGPKASAVESTLPNPSGGDFYPCKGCAEFFQTPLDLMQHHIKNNHHLLRDKEFWCEVCQKCFLHKASLKTHMIIHTGERPFACDICGKRFNIKSARNRHIRYTHRQEKNCPCKFCGRRFSGQTNLTHHIRSIHTLEKPFPCEMCEKKFPRKDYLMYHIRKHHTNERPFVCDVCQKCYLDASSLKFHMSKHSTQKRYICRKCGKKYQFRAELKIHKLENCTLDKTIADILMENKTVSFSALPREVGNLNESLGKNETVCQNVSSVDCKLEELHAEDVSSSIAIVSLKEKTLPTYTPPTLTANSLLPSSDTMTSSSKYKITPKYGINQDPDIFKTLALNLKDKALEVSKSTSLGRTLSPSSNVIALNSENDISNHLTPTNLVTPVLDPSSNAVRFSAEDKTLRLSISSDIKAPTSSSTTITLSSEDKTSKLSLPTGFAAHTLCTSSIANPLNPEGNTSKFSKPVSFIAHNLSSMNSTFSSGYKTSKLSTPTNLVTNPLSPSSSNIILSSAEKTYKFSTLGKAHTLYPSSNSVTLSLENKTSRFSTSGNLVAQTSSPSFSNPKLISGQRTSKLSTSVSLITHTLSTSSNTIAFSSGDKSTKPSTSINPVTSCSSSFAMTLRPRGNTSKVSVPTSLVACSLSSSSNVATLKSKEKNLKLSTPTYRASFTVSPYASGSKDKRYKVSMPSSLNTHTLSPSSYTAIPSPKGNTSKIATSMNHTVSPCSAVMLSSDIKPNLKSSVVTNPNTHVLYSSAKNLLSKCNSSCNPSQFANVAPSISSVFSNSQIFTSAKPSNPLMSSKLVSGVQCSSQTQASSTNKSSDLSMVTNVITNIPSSNSITLISSSRPSDHVPITRIMKLTANAQRVDLARQEQITKLSSQSRLFSFR